MPYDAYGNYVPSKANNRTDVFGYDAIGGVGQLIYHLVRFKEYELDYTEADGLIARPYCQKGYEPELYTKDSPSGADLTASIYNLAKKNRRPLRREVVHGFDYRMVQAVWSPLCH